MRGILILVATGGMLALAGAPVPEPGQSLLFGTSRFVTTSLARLAAPAVSAGTAAPGTGTTSLLVLAGGFFAAAAIVRRRP